MNYQLASAMRGPDVGDSGEWKRRVTAPLRWFAIMELGKDRRWCEGAYIEHPDKIMKKPVSDRAVAFAERVEAGHVQSHARDAFRWLIASAQTQYRRRLAKALFTVLTEQRLL